MSTQTNTETGKQKPESRDKDSTPMNDYWRSLDHLENSPEFQAWTAKEFPGFVNVYEGLGEAQREQGGLTRRQFLALSAAGMAFAGAGCYRRPDLQILPYSQPPENVTPGLPTYYATSIPRPNGAFPVLVESHEGRPTKIEGNPKHPCSRGSTDTFAQSSILDLYSPERSTRVLIEGELKCWEELDLFVGGHFKKILEANGKGLFFLSEKHASPALRTIQEHIRRVKKTDDGKIEKNDKGEIQYEGAFAESSWHTYEPIDDANIHQGAREAFGQSLSLMYHFDKADCILVLDSDPFGLDPNSVKQSRDFADRRRVPEDSKLKDWHPNRLYVVENTYTITGTIADHRLRLPTCQIIDYIVALAKEIVKQLKLDALSTPALAELNKLAIRELKIPDVWIGEVAADLIAHAGKSLIVTGYKQPVPVQVLAHLVNDLLKNHGQTISFRSKPDENALGLKELVAAIQKNEVSTLILLGGNPVQNAPADYDLGNLFKQVPTIIRVGMFVDETSAKSNVHIPMTHYLEEWGDAESPDGTYCMIQPLIAPLHGGRSVLELLIQWSKFDDATSNKLAKEKILPLIKTNYLKRNEKGDDVAFNRFIQEGFFAGTIPSHKAELDANKIGSILSQTRLSAPLSDNSREIVFHADYSVFDGRFSTNGWLMELPDPITKLVWDNAALVSQATARDLGIAKNGDMIQIETAEKRIQIPVFILPGQADDSISLPLGYGRLKVPHAPEGGGFDVYPLRTSNGLHFTRAKLKKLSTTYRLVTTQEWGTIPDGRHEIIHDYSLTQFEKLHHSHSEKEHHDHTKENFQAGYLEGMKQQRKERIRLDLAHPENLEGPHQWGMVIDLNTCIGCTACVVACQSENNIPIVGKGEVANNREMHWIRIDRYFASKGATTAGVESQPTEDPRIVTQPMMCQHCEAAPCESVCPVNASVHSPEGLNLQVYNRCIGTRYCGNNCPYKVRKFNYFDFNQRNLDELRVPTPLSEKGSPETIKMQKNPDVTVRGRGVMEKCTYCIQRIERAKIGAKLAASDANYSIPSDPKKAGYDIRQIEGAKKIFVPDGVITPACSQACPTQAIVFGNVSDPNSKAFQLKQRQEDYLVQGSKNTRPRTSYSPRIRNYNPKMLKEGSA